MKANRMLFLVVPIALMYSAGARAERSYSAGHFALQLDGVFSGLLNSVDGGAVSADVIDEKAGPDTFIKKHIGQPKYEDFDVQLGFNMSKNVYEWIEASWANNYVRKSGSLVAGSVNFKTRSVRPFFDATISEVTIPACDGSSKEPGYMRVKFSPESTTYQKGDGAQVQGDFNSRDQKVWHPSNFRFEMGGLDTSRISKIDSFTVKQGVAKDQVGDARDYQREPGKIEFPNLKVTFDNSTAQPWIDWQDDFVIKGNNGDDKEKNGAIVFLDQNRQTELMRVLLYQCGIFRLGDANQANHTEVSLYCERMVLKVNSDKK